MSKRKAKCKECGHEQVISNLSTAVGSYPLCEKCEHKEFYDLGEV